LNMLLLFRNSIWKTVKKKIIVNKNKNMISGGGQYSREHSKKIRELAKKDCENYIFPKEKLKANEGIVLVECGSFNPITFMHLRILEEAKDFGYLYGMNVIGGYISLLQNTTNSSPLCPAILLLLFIY